MKIANTLSRGEGLLPLAAAALLATASTSAAAPRFVMEIKDHDGNPLIEGESTAKWHEGGIDVISFGKGFTGSEALPSLTSTSFTCGIVSDKALPKLMEAATTGLLLPAVQVAYLGDTDSSLDRVQIVLEHVQVTAVGMHGRVPADQTITYTGLEFAAEVSFNFSKISWVYRQQDEEGNTLDQTEHEYVGFKSTEDPGFDDDGDGIPNDKDDDDDNDKVKDDYEEEHGTNAFVADGHLDHDGDGRSTRDEALAGTRADDPTSFFSIRSVSVEHTPEGPRVKVHFPWMEGRNYRLLGSPDARLPKEHWFELATVDGEAEGEAEITLDPTILPQLHRMLFTVEVREQNP